MNEESFWILIQSWERSLEFKGGGRNRDGGEEKEEKQTLSKCLQFTKELYQSRQLFWAVA